MEGSSGGAWLAFLGIFALVCFAYPPVLGLVLGVGGFCLLWCVIYKSIGGH